MNKKIYLINLKIFSIKPANTNIKYKILMRRRTHMLKLLAKVAEKMARNTNTACFVWFITHQPKMPASLIKKD